jgi:hypothetical protein
MGVSTFKEATWFPWKKNKKPKKIDPSPYDLNPTISTCPKCGLELKQVMMYYCSNFPCPTGLGSRVMI